MKYIFRGSLCGYICDDCTEWLSDVEVLLYRPWQPDRVLATTVANPKETFHIVTKDEAAQRKDLLIARAKTDANGNFELSVDEKYKDSAFDIDFVCGTVPRTPPVPPRKELIQIHLTTVFPQWRANRDQESFFYQWQHCVDAKWWCYIRGFYFDAWVICGYLRNCQTRTPIANAQVTAWDADFLSDDNLGTVTTDVNGHFRIDYTSVQFKQTFLSPWLNIETEPGTLLSHQFGPDVYFKAELGGVTLVNETKANRRNNVGYCLCVELCSTVPVVDPGNPGDLPTVWTGIGNRFSSSFGINSQDFDANGYAGDIKCAISNVIRLTGQAPPTTSAGHHVEYRFLVSDVTTPNNAPSPAIGNFTKIVGVTPGLFSPSHVLTLSKKIPDFINDILWVYNDQADFDAQGWYAVNKSIERTLTNAGLTIADLPLYWIVDENTLISLNTTVLTTAADVPAAAAAVGDPVPVASKIPIEKVAVRFEIRDAITLGVPPGNSGHTLNSMIINNNSMFMKLSITELEATGLCNPISGTVHAKYTVYHPHLSSAIMHLNNNSHTVDRDITDSVPPTPQHILTLSGNTNPAIDSGANNSLQLNNTPNDLTKCTYSLKLWASARLHNGDDFLGNFGPLEQLFFYNI